MRSTVIPYGAAGDVELEAAEDKGCRARRQKKGWDPRSGVANGLKTNLCLKFSVLELIDFHRPKMRTRRKNQLDFHRAGAFSQEKQLDVFKLSQDFDLGNAWLNSLNMGRMRNKWIVELIVESGISVELIIIKKFNTWIVLSTTGQFDSSISRQELWQKIKRRNQ